MLARQRNSGMDLPPAATACADTQRQVANELSARSAALDAREAALKKRATDLSNREAMFMNRIKALVADL